MRILFVSIWPANSGIFQATILPTLNYWLDNSIASHVTLLSFDQVNTQIKLDSTAFSHISLIADPKQSHAAALKYQVSATLKVVKQGSFDMLWARGVTSGNIVYLASFSSHIPFGVESFEPHANYMLEGRVWSKNSVKTRVQKWFESKMIKRSKLLITVSSHYTKLLTENYPNMVKKTYTMPCAVDFEKFKFDGFHREKIRTQYQIQPQINVGIYVGKFGDIYYDDEFFHFLKTNIFTSDNQFVIILTPSPEHAIAQVKKFGMDKQKFLIKTALHDEVAEYLSASDYAFCPVVSSPSRIFCSPIKTGEYMANGLPILISAGIGEDSEFIETHGLGKVVNYCLQNETQNLALDTLKRVNEISKPVFDFRSQNALFSNYKNIFESLKS